MSCKLTRYLWISTEGDRPYKITGNFPKIFTKLIFNLIRSSKQNYKKKLKILLVEVIVLFRGYEVAKRYIKKIKLQNIGNEMFRISSHLDNESLLIIHVASATKPIADLPAAR